MNLDDLLPQRGRWRLVNRVVSVDADRAVAEFDFTAEFTEGHFPGQPVVPGVALLEGLAQTLLILARTRAPDAEGIPFLAAFDRVRFRAPVLPPATVRFDVTIVGERAGLTQAQGTAYVGEKRVCTAQLTGAVLQLPEDGTP